MTTRMSDLTIHDGLAIVTLDGFDGYKMPEHGDMIDPPGTANWFCEQYGMSTDDDDGFAAPGIIWTDYDLGGWRFSVLIDTDEVEDLDAFAKEAGYEVVSAEVVTEPTHYGDGHSGTVEILKHRDGWVILAN